MKTKSIVQVAAVARLTILNPQLSTVRDATTIDSVNRYAYGANIGWIKARGGR